ncbi:MAG: hypothetical protein G01um101424_286 [Parcubacteria group bacterium Gr01-1014_24]|nr:MAG: hypothetical protein G01um101424_286 [Parcubacteria group bacterium Gr01-1014_24]
MDERKFGSVPPQEGMKTEAEKAKDVRDRIGASPGHGSHYEWDNGIDRVPNVSEAAALLDEMRRLIRAQMNERLHFADRSFTENTVQSLANRAAKRLGVTVEEIMAECKEKDTTADIEAYRKK